MNGFYDATKTQKMPAYGHALDPMDAWAIVAYLRVLQETRALKIDAIPEAERATLQANKPAPAPLGVSGGKP